MPVIHVHFWKGPNTATKHALAASITDVVVQHLHCAPEAITILLDEIDKERWYIGGVDSATKFPG